MKIRTKSHTRRKQIKNNNNNMCITRKKKKKNVTFCLTRFVTFCPTHEFQTKLFCKKNR